MISSLYLGRVAYDAALRLQEELAAHRIAGRIPNTLLLLEHPPVLTLGRNASRGNILASPELLTRRGVSVYEINRGGDVTYHAPGQLVGYPIFDLRSLRGRTGGRLGPVDFVRQIEEALIRLCGEFGVAAGRIPGLTGVWCPADGSPLDESADTMSSAQPNGERKIAAIGIHVSRGVTSHGFAFNVTTDLSGFELIVPCGIADRAVTSLEQELEQELARSGRSSSALPSLEAIARSTTRLFGQVFQEPVQTLDSLAALRAFAAKSDTSNSFPAQDTPLQVPPEIERLRNPGGPRFRA